MFDCPPQIQTSPTSTFLISTLSWPCEIAARAARRHPGREHGLPAALGGSRRNSLAGDVHGYILFLIGRAPHRHVGLLLQHGSIGEQRVRSHALSAVADRIIAATRPLASRKIACAFIRNLLDVDAWATKPGGAGKCLKCRRFAPCFQRPIVPYRAVTCTPRNSRSSRLASGSPWRTLARLSRAVENGASARFRSVNISWRRIEMRRLLHLRPGTVVARGLVCFHGPRRRRQSVGRRRSGL